MDWGYMKILAGIATAAALFAASSASAATLVDFSTNFGGVVSEGDVITDFDFGGGLTGSITTIPGKNATGEAMIFDTRPGTASVGNDRDLKSPFTNVNDASDKRGFDNALILQEKGSTDGPDDAARGGIITFNFDKAIRLASLSILDGNDNSPTGASLFLDLATVAFATNLGGGDNEFETILPDVTVNSFSVRFAGSGAIGQFEASAVPLPAALPMFLLALAGLGAYARRKNAA